jgi:hypothetical protein
LRNNEKRLKINTTSCIYLWQTLLFFGEVVWNREKR